tara:strand:+ start:29 stop:511 length:483 start_codon:yes stop_codon:yes gene_type:complete
MAVSKGRYQYSFKQGNDAEKKFKDLMELRGHTCIKSSRSDDINKHIDFYVNEFSVDVKGNRHLETIWLELKNVRGNKGWLEGEADYIVFDVVELKSFCFFNTEKLFNYVKDIKEIAKDKKDYNKLYTRKERKDVLVKVRYNDIKHLEKQKIKYEQETEQY